MYVDALNEFSNSQAVTSTVLGDTVIDLGPTPTVRDLGQGEPVYLVVQTSEAVTDTGDDAKLTLTLESDTVATLDSSPTVHFSTGALPFASFSGAGSLVVAVALPYGDYKRYMGVRFTVANGPLTGGKFDAFLTADVQRWKALPGVV